MRVIGWAMAILAIGALGLALFGIGPSIASLWSEYHANSLVGLQGFVDGTLDPDPGNPTIWFNWVLPVLGVSAFWPAAVVLGLLTLIIILATRPEI